MGRISLKRPLVEYIYIYYIGNQPRSVYFIKKNNSDNTLEYKVHSHFQYVLYMRV